MINRHVKILDAITQRQKIEVSALAELLNVSKVTIRKDLAELEELGVLRREHGFAVAGPTDDIGRRMAYKYETKRRIAQAAARSVIDGETVLIESGSNCAFLAEELANNKRDVTIITNSSFIAHHIRHAPHIKIILLGGDYQTEAQVTVGPIVLKCAEEFFTDKLFIGADGFTEKFGFTGRDHIRAETVQGLAKQSRQVIVLTDSDKFSHQGVVRLVRTEDVSAVYTDDRIPPEVEAFLLQKQILVHKAPSETQDEPFNRTISSTS
ncbi:transcriptional regulator, DeoR family [Treponema primitia ZAS-2]|uniref:Transcriptional regulator, DeoR family n=1 Tax=Treponema primitia (strain ATCC BAA-887 / DSM 12427 / ZAS-2) TaxID=545694 RepID=F5YMI7_TREPZ|nr:DeoR/GlpR family DNA-binding transcription regulator [Treponema primitia]AEF86169.1 transcriptional regulator, DeoR family [Treponema primitia ZAS-2]